MGQIGDSIAYTFFLMFYFFFLTEVAGVRPSHAGIINLIVILYDAVSDPIIGYLSDACKSRFGRRRPFLLIGAPFVGLFVFLCFSTFGFTETGKFIYYIIITIFFWTAYTVFDIPYYAFGAELTQDFDERTKLRTWGSIAIMLAGFTAGLAPYLANLLGDTPQTGWSRTALVIGGVIVICDLMCWYSTRGREIENTGDKTQKTNLVHSYIQTLKLKPLKYVVSANFLCLLGQSINIALAMHVMTYIAPVTEAQISMFYILMPVFGACWLPLVNFVSLKTGKRISFIIFLSFTFLGLLVFYIADTYTFTSMLLLAVIIEAGIAAFWTLCYAMAYDTTELDEFVSGQRREGNLLSLMSLSQKTGNAVGFFLLGFILEIIQYNAELEVQPESAINGIKFIFTAGSGSIIFIAALIIFFYPLRKKEFEAVSRALAARKEGREFSTEEFQHLL